MTVLFCDLVGSTALADRLDPEDLREVMRLYLETCAEAIAPFEGYVAQTLGDGLMAYFGFPIAHEGDAHRAVRAGLALVSAVSEPQGVLRRRWPECAVRVGIQTGVVFAGHVAEADTRNDRALIGMAPNVAARLQQLAGTNEVIIGPGTETLVAGNFQLEHRGVHSLKGVADPVPVWRVCPESNPGARLEARWRHPLGPLVGRRKEFDRAMDCWRKAAAGQSQLLVVSGPAGIGKSRLTRALRQEVALQDSTCLVFRCSPYYQHTPLHPVVVQLRKAAGIHRDDPPAARYDKLVAALSSQGPERRAQTDLIARLLQIPSPADQARYGSHRLLDETIAALRQQLFVLGRARPLLVIIEDMHWSDPTTQELVRQVMLPEQPLDAMLMVVTQRDESDVMSPAWVAEHCSARERVNRLQLSGLNGDSCRKIVQHHFGKRRPPSEVLRRILALGDGNPLYVEELAKGLRDAGPSLEQAAVPLSLRDSLMARLDATGAAKRLAQLAAVVGRMFSYELLSVVADTDEAFLHESIDILIRSEIIRHEVTGSQHRFAFRHALMHSAAYDSLLRSERREVHGKVASYLELHHPRLCEEAPELLARHLEAAERMQEAAVFWFQAGKAAQVRAAHTEAITHFGLCIQALGRVDQSEARDRLEVDAQAALAYSHMVKTGWGGARVNRAQRRAAELCRALGDRRRECEMTWALWGYEVTRGELMKARERAQAYLALAQSTEDRGSILMAESTVLHTMFCLGRYREATQHARSIQLAYRDEEDGYLVQTYNHDPMVVASMCQSQWLWVMGLPDQAMAVADAAVARARTLDHPFQLIYALLHTALVFLWRGDLARARAQGSEALSLAKLHRHTVFQVYGPLLLAPAYGDSEGFATPLLERSLGAMREAGSRLYLPLGLVHTSARYEAQGRMQLAYERCREAQAVAEQTAERWCLPEVYRLRARLSRACGGSEVEELHWLQRGLALAQRMKARAFELRLTRDLVAAYAPGERADAAAAQLSHLVASFREGLDTEDLRAARSAME